MGSNITLSDYIAAKNPQGAVVLLKRHGYRQPNNVREVGRGLANLISVKGPDALSEIAEIHPDKDLILAMLAKDQSSSNACGCGCAASGASNASGCSCEKNSNAAAETVKEGQSPVAVQGGTTDTQALGGGQKDKLPYIAGAAVVLLLLIAIKTI